MRFLAEERGFGGAAELLRVSAAPSVGDFHQLAAPRWRAGRKKKLDPRFRGDDGWEILFLVIPAKAGIQLPPAA
jgi:hypothetical protein